MENNNLRELDKDLEAIGVDADAFVKKDGKLYYNGKIIPDVEIVEAIEGLKYNELSDYVFKIKEKVKSGQADEYDDLIAEKAIDEMEEFRFWKMMEQEFQPYGKITINLETSLEGLKYQLDKFLKLEDSLINRISSKATNTYHKCIRKLRSEIAYRENLLKKGEKEKPKYRKEKRPYAKRMKKEVLVNE